MTPIGFSTTNSFTDTVQTPGMYYYAIVADNEYGQSVISNVEAVTVTGLFSSRKYPIEIHSQIDSKGCNRKFLSYLPLKYSLIPLIGNTIHLHNIPEHENIP